MGQLLTHGHRPGPAGSVVLADRLPGDGRVLAWPSHFLVAVEGRLGALRSSDADSWALAGRDELVPVAQQLAHGVSCLVGHAVAGADAEVRRLDLAGEVTFDVGRDGLAFLGALAHHHAPRCKVVTWRGADGTPQSVYWVAEKSGQIALRAYDKGVEAGTHRPGERVRVERQHRARKRARKRPAVVASEDLTGLYAGPLRTWMEAPVMDTMPATDLAAVAAMLDDRVDRGLLSDRRAARVLWDAHRLGQRGRGVYEERTARRRVAELRRLGIGLGESYRRPAPASNVVPIEILRELRARFAA
jgi:hypothetical protein